MFRFEASKKKRFEKQRLHHSQLRQTVKTIENLIDNDDDIARIK